jgi:hypothetical protein
VHVPTPLTATSTAPNAPDSSKTSPCSGCGGDGAGGQAPPRHFTRSSIPSAAAAAAFRRDAAGRSATGSAKRSTNGFSGGASSSIRSVDAGSGSRSSVADVATITNANGTVAHSGYGGCSTGSTRPASSTDASGGGAQCDSDDGGAMTTKQQPQNARSVYIRFPVIGCILRRSFGTYAVMPCCHLRLSRTSRAADYWRATEMLLTGARQI